MRLTFLSAAAAGLLLAAMSCGAARAGDAPVRCDAVVAAYNGVAGSGGVPDILKGWTADGAASFRFRDAGGGTGAKADSGLLCNRDGSLERFEFILSWTGDVPLRQMASAEIAAETISSIVSPNGKPPNFEDLVDIAVHNAEMLNLSTQAEWAPTGDGYEAYASITRAADGGAVTYAIRRSR